MFPLFSTMHLPFGVVPIFVNAGAALLPAIMAGLASVAMLILRPRELFALCRRKPYVPVIAVVAIAGIWFGGKWAFSPHQAAAAAPTETGTATTAAGPSRTDWTEVALAIIRNQNTPGVAVSGMVPAVPVAGNIPGDVPTVPSGEAPVTPGAPVLPAGAVKPGPTAGAAPAQGALAPATFFRTGAARSGFDGGVSPVGLRPLWGYSEDMRYFLSSPLVVGNKVYGATCVFDGGNALGSVFCLDANSGKKLWETNEVNGEKLKGIFSSPAITADGRNIVIGMGLHEDSDCRLVCLSALTGAPRWAVKTSLHLESSPAIFGDMAVVGAGAIEGTDHKPTTHPGYVFAVRISDGKELWRFNVNDPESSPVIDEKGIVYIGSGFNGNAVVALRSDTDAALKAKGQKRLLWKVSTPYPATGAITLVGDLLLLGAGNGDYVYDAPDPAGVVMALDRASGNVRWQTKMSNAVLGAVAVQGDVAVCTSRNGEVAALKLADGKVLWRSVVNENEAVLAGPAFTGKYVYAVSNDGYLAVMQATDGKVIEKHYINAEDMPGNRGLSLSSPTIAGGRVYVGSETGGLWCFAGTK